MRVRTIDENRGNDRIMNLDDAIKTHAEWKLKFRAAMSRKEQLDAPSIERDDCCMLGKWIHGEGKSQFARHGEFTEVRERHRDFHKHAGTVARHINAGRYEEAERMLENGTPYAIASRDVGVAVQRLKKLAA